LIKSQNLFVMKKILSTISLLVLLFACKKTSLPDQQSEEVSSTSENKKGGTTSSLSVTTNSVSVSSAVSAYVYGTVSSSGGGSSVSETGFCYSTSPAPTIANNTVTTGSGSGNFQRSITGLSVSTTYYVKAYAIKSGTAYYGNELSFTTLSLGLPSAGIGTVTDIDGNVYNTITLGTQVWMVENLKTTRFRDGTVIPNVTDGAPWSYSSTAITPAYCDFNNTPANSNTYGRLYNLFAMKDSRGIAPAGWHVPNFAEWNTLFNYLGGAGIAGGRMKETGNTHWLYPNTGADNSSGFTALGTGDRAWASTGSFCCLQSRASFWSSSSSYGLTSNSAYLNVIYLNYNSASYSMTLGGISGGQNFGFAIRCVKDN
jgi:uncharacterized protein (TIGR02145 family)